MRESVFWWIQSFMKIDKNWKKRFFLKKLDAIQAKDFDEFFLFRFNHLSKFIRIEKREKF